jgi:hypothetical protein
MVAANVNVQVTQDDMNGVIRDNPMVALQLQVRALTRTCQEQADQIQDLEAQLKSRTKGKDGRNADG